MPDWLQDSFVNDEAVSAVLVFIRLAGALGFGCLVAGIYHLTSRRSGKGALNLVPTLVLLTVLIGMITLVIGSSVARAFSLVGALSIVRFRTVVEDTRDTAFVIFAVAVGMAMGSGFLMVVVIGLPVAAVAAFLFRYRPGLEQNGISRQTLVVRIAIGFDPEAALNGIFERYLCEWSTMTMLTVRQGSALELSYTVRLKPDSSPLSFVSELNATDGVQNVEWKS